MHAIITRIFVVLILFTSLFFLIPAPVQADHKIQWGTTDCSTCGGLKEWGAQTDAGHPASGYRSWTYYEIACPGSTAASRTCTAYCSTGSVSATETGSTCNGNTTWNGCPASCPACTSNEGCPGDYAYAANSCYQNNGSKACYFYGPSNCNYAASRTDYSTTNNCDACHVADRAAGPSCGCVKLDPPTSPTISELSLSPSTTVKSGTTVTPSASASNHTGITYTPSSLLACNIGASDITSSFSAYSYKNWACTYRPDYQQSRTVTASVTIQPWFPAIVGNPSITPNNLYDDEPMAINATPFNSGSDTTSISFNFAGQTDNVPQTAWNGERAEGTTHTVTFTPIRHDSCPTDKHGTAKTASHTTRYRPAPAIRNIAISKPLSRKGEPITVTGEIQNSHLWDFNILMDWQGNGANMESFHLGHSAGRYNSASQFFTTNTGTEGSWDRFSMTFTPTRETTSLSANIKINYHRILKPTSYRAANINTNVTYEVAFLPIVTGVTIAPESGVLTATITGDKFRILSKINDSVYRGDVFFNSTSKSDVTAISRGNLISWTMNQIKVTYPPVTGDVKVCLNLPIADGCSNTDKQYFYETDRDTTSTNNSWWTFKTLPPPECRINIIDPPLTFLYVLSKQDTSDPFLVQASWRNFDLRSPINITTTLTPASPAITFTGPSTFDTTNQQDGNSTIQLVAVTTQAPIGRYSLEINATSPIAGGWNCIADSFNVVVDVDPFLKTTGGDVHSNQEINIPGGL